MSVHVLILPYPAQGHLLPLLDLTHQLALHGLTITILVTPKNRPTLDPLLSTHPSIGTLVLPFPHHPAIPSGVENVKDLGNSGNVLVINALSKLRDPIIQWFKAHPNPPVAIVSDFFLGWTNDLAGQLGIPRVAFYSSGAFLTSILFHFYRELRSAAPVLTAVKFTDLPRSPSFTEAHLPTIVRHYRESNPEWELLKEGVIANSWSWGSILNTFDDLEGEFLEYLKKKMGHNRVYGVGPLNLGRVNTDPDADPSNTVLGWLDGCPDGSVIYVCFGSQKFLKKAQIEALALGLERSKARFIWVVKPITAQQEADGYGSILDGFEERVSGRGMVIKGWAPQVKILSHRVVYGFLSHCGWNSVLEAIAAGVMILGWPMEADQFVNARLLVDYMGAAVRVCEGADSVPDSDELARTIAESVDGNKQEKGRARELRDKAWEAVGPCGSSTKDLVGFVKDLAQLDENGV